MPTNWSPESPKQVQMSGKGKKGHKGEKKKGHATVPKPVTVRKKSYKQAGLVEGMKKFNTSKLAECIALPGATEGFRMPTVDAPRTSVMAVRDQYTITADTTAGANPKWNQGDLLVAFFGQPGRLAAIFTTLSTGSYQALFAAATSTNTVGVWTLHNQTVPGSMSPELVWPIVGFKTLSGAPPHGKQMAVGVTAPETGYVFMNTGDTITNYATSWTSTAVGNVIFNVYNWVGKDSAPYEAVLPPITLVSGNVPAGTIFTASAPGHYMLQYNGIYITSGAVTSAANGIVLNLNCNSTVGWRMVYMPDLDFYADGDRVIGEECRMVGSSLLMTNTTSVLNRQGTVLAARMRADNFLDVTPAVLAKCAEKYTGDAAKGVYTFKEFSSMAEKFVSSTNDSGGLRYDINTDDYFHFVHISCPNLSANTFTLSLDSVVEFKTDVARYRKGVAYFSYDDLIAARKLINSNPNWFYENPMHMSDIYGFIRRGASAFAKGIRKYAPMAAAVGGALNPAGAATYNALADLLRQV